MLMFPRGGKIDLHFFFFLRGGSGKGTLSGVGPRGRDQLSGGGWTVRGCSGRGVK